MKDGFIVEDGTYAAIPFGKQLMIIHHGKQLQVCKTITAAKKFIQQHKKMSISITDY
jgi:hypothetical protein